MTKFSLNSYLRDVGCGKTDILLVDNRYTKKWRRRVKSKVTDYYANVEHYYATYNLINLQFINYMIHFLSISTDCIDIIWLLSGIPMICIADLALYFNMQVWLTPLCYTVTTNSQQGNAKGEL